MAIRNRNRKRNEDEDMIDMIDDDVEEIYDDLDDIEDDLDEVEFVNDLDDIYDDDIYDDVAYDPYYYDDGPNVYLSDRSSYIVIAGIAGVLGLMWWMSQKK